MTVIRAVGALLLGGWACAACSVDIQGSHASVREEKRFALVGADPVELTLRTFDGAIRVRSWDRSEVLVETERRAVDQASAEALKVDASQEGNRLVVDAPSPGRRDFGVSPSVHFTVTVPRRVTLHARTGDGAVDASDLEGLVELNTGDGPIQSAGIEGQLTAHTGDGPISIERTRGRVDVDSGDGPVTIAGRLTELTARTGDGPVRVEAEDGSAMGRDWSITTGDGRIEVRLPPGFNAEVEAHTGDGAIHVAGLEPPVPQDRDGSDRHDVRGRIGSGGPTLRLRTGDGPIDVAR
jgi:hypothetical protein